MFKKVDYVAEADAIITEFGFLEADVRAVAVEAMGQPGNQAASRLIKSRCHSMPAKAMRPFARAAWCLLKVERAAAPPKRAAGPRCFCPACVDARERKARKAAAATAATVNTEGTTA